MQMQTTKLFHLAALAAVASLQLTAPSAHAQLVIDPATNYLTGSRPSGVAAGDFDNDGDMDLATTVDNPDRIVVLINDGSGQYSIGPITNLPNSSSPQDLVAGQLDGIGGIDLAVAVRDPQGSVLIMLNTGGGSFTLSGSVIVGDRPRGLAIADMDNDGDLDLAVANRDSDSASVLTNNGTGSFSAFTFFAGAEPRATAFVNFGGDGDLDLAVTIHDDRSIATFTNNSGVFVPSTVYDVGPFVRPDGMTAADLDGDGLDDLAIAVEDQTFVINQLAVLINTGNGFIGPFNFDTGGLGANKVAAADFDCDGAIDVVVTNQDSNNVSYLRNLGGAIFAAPIIMAAGTRPGEITTTDADGDGDPDTAVANRDSNDMSVLINQSCDPGKATITPPAGYDAFRGFLASGTLADLLESDDNDLCYEPGIVLGPTEAPVTLDFTATLPNDSPSSLDVTIESSANTVGLEITVSYWNYNTTSWDVVGAEGQSLNADTIKTFAGTPADHVEPGSGEVRTRYEVRQVSLIFIFPWLDCVDHVFWSTTN